ncbi:breast cancer anti-estrogen resistance protein 3 homolog [Eupeodes corollae]|uniref:breast cancer anti-estrogen resistance protein 3 homolog n=1 Tax=Eupeodes corollae TaxID=290404 RepID=UPI00248FA3C9|nr:breast cancer anti-estrogen resistance protein 3 homolog [Eupeodes corollae]XP_055920891.1 breast cancer anti-estrogen resistance protein 3 homolog [Eupeodes corollae]XP_055920892.1 breast cancer anti-estrogen resistance protein 3 homolog [Eupeodes corollae]
MDDMDPNSTSSEAQEAIALKKALEWELSLDSRDLRSHAWYHGPLPRQRAEEIVQKDGDFLIRDCASQPDNYVLSCKTKASVLHFVINKILLQPETVYERVQYQFEEDAFDAVPDLITFYVGSGKPISAASGARIQYPCNRTYPLSFYGHKIVGNQLHTQMLAGIRGGSPLSSPSLTSPGFRFTPYNQQNNSYKSPMSSPPRTKRDTPPRLPSKKQRSQSLTPSQSSAVSSIKSVETCSSADGVIQQNETSTQKSTTDLRRLKNGDKSSSVEGIPPQPVGNHCNGFQTIARSTISETVEHVKFTTHSLPRPSVGSLRFASMKSQSLNRDSGENSLSPCIESKNLPEVSEKAPSPPPKPIRPPALPKKEKDLHEQLPFNRVGSYHASGSDSGNGSGDSVQSSTPGDVSESNQHRGVIIKNPRFLPNSVSSVTLKSLTEFDVAEAEEELSTMECPTIESVSKFDVENFSTLLLPSCENNPLDGDALSTFKMMLLESGPKILAEHITRIDINLIIDKVVEVEDSDANILQCCGLELLTLPHGTTFRNDLLERTQCMKLMVAVTILTCQTDLDRAEILSKWIQVAVDTKTALGNLFGFSAIMLGLCMPQIQRLDNAWHILRQKFTDSAFTFEAKLRPTLKNMNECSNPQAPNTTVPHVLLYILLRDRIIENMINSAATEKSSLVTSCITPWETKADDFGMAIYFLHLDSARGFLRNLSLFRKNSKTVMDESNSRLDELLSDAFRTEFHIKFLWGSKGALATPEDRHSKLEKVLALMADKFCNADNISTAP